MPPIAVAGKAFTDYASGLSPAELELLGHAYLERVWALSPQSRYISDKIPTNFFHIGMIYLMFPDAKIIHSMRDPIDTCFPCYTRFFTNTMNFAYDFSTLGRFTARYLRLMRHWREVLPAGTVLDVRYEGIVDNVEVEARQMLEYIGLPWSDDCLNFHKNKRQVKTASIVQVRKPIYRSSVGRGKNFEKHLGPLTTIVDTYCDQAT